MCRHIKLTVLLMWLLKFARSDNKHDVISIRHHCQLFVVCSEPDVSPLWCTEAWISPFNRWHLLKSRVRLLQKASPFWGCLHTTGCWREQNSCVFKITAACSTLGCSEACQLPHMHSLYWALMWASLYWCCDQKLLRKSCWLSCTIRRICGWFGINV